MRGTPRGAKRDYRPVRHKSLPISVGFALSSVMLSAFLLIPRLYASQDRDTPNPGFVTEFSAPLDDVLEALQEVLQDGTIHGTLMKKNRRLLVRLLQGQLHSSHLGRAQARSSIRFATMP